MDRHTGGARRHVLDAIRVNVQRRRYYAEATRGRSRPLTWLLVAAEILCLAPLALFDRWSRKYNRRGIPIVRADFASMRGIPEASAPLRFDGRAAPDHLRWLRDEIRTYQSAVREDIGANDFRETARRTFELLELVRGLEERSASLFSMTRHTLESVGLAAYHAIRYAEQSDGETHLLSRWFLRFQILGVRAAPWIDAKAQICHTLGAGIVENDVPPMPFEEAWRSSGEPGAQRAGGPGP